MLDATVTAQSRLQTPEQFRNIIVKSDPSGARVLLADVARVELGADNYSATIRINGHPGAGIGIYLEPGANALSTSKLVKAYMKQAAPRLPPGYEVAYANDSSDFIRLSVIEVVKTLAEAMALVIIVMFVFLQSWRATLIPGIAIPVVLLGTFGMLYILGFSINTLTLFGLVLAVGLLVDDAIVVVENVERILHEQPELTTKEATIVSMQQIQMALVAIALVLSAVFLPMIFFGGSTGVIYRQFSATIVSAMALSVILAITFSPSLAANVLRRQHASVEDTWLGKRAPRFAHGIEIGPTRFQPSLPEDHRLVRRQRRTRRRAQMALPAHLSSELACSSSSCSSAFRPASSRPRTRAMPRFNSGFQRARRSAERSRSSNRSRITSCMVPRRRTSTSSSRSPAAVAAFRDRTPARRTSTSHRSISAAARPTAPTPSWSALPAHSAAFATRRSSLSSPERSAASASPAASPWSFRTRAGLSREQFAAARDRLLAGASADPALEQVRLSELPDVASLKVNVDQQRLAALGLTSSDVNSTLSTAWGGRYVNDFIDRGRVKRVYVQGDAPYRSEPSDIGNWYVRNNQGQMVPFSSFATTGWTVAPVTLDRFEGYPSFEIDGQPAPGKSSGQAMDEISKSSRRKFRVSASPGRARLIRSGSPPGRRRFSTPSR